MQGKNITSYFNVVLEHLIPTVQLFSQIQKLVECFEAINQLYIVMDLLLLTLWRRYTTRYNLQNVLIYNKRCVDEHNNSATRFVINRSIHTISSSSRLQAASRASLPIPISIFRKTPRSLLRSSSVLPISIHLPFCVMSLRFFRLRVYSRRYRLCALVVMMVYEKQRFRR